jgi:hypothetical protein
MLIYRAREYFVFKKNISLTYEKNMGKKVKILMKTILNTQKFD